MTAAVIENIITICAFAVIVILAPGWWKWAAFACLLNLNSIRPRRESD